MDNMQNTNGPSRPTAEQAIGVVDFGDDFRTKSGLMLGLGETEAELMTTFEAMVASGVDILTLGQYLRPTRHQLPVKAYIHPDDFAELGRKGQGPGLPHRLCRPPGAFSFNAHEVKDYDGIAIV